MSGAWRDSDRGRTLQSGILSVRSAVGKNQLAFALVDFHLAAVLQFAEQDLVGEHALDFILNEPRHRPGAEGWIIAALGKPAPRLRRELQEYFALIQLLIEFNDELVDHPFDVFLAQRIERDHGVEPLAEFRTEPFFDGFLAATGGRLRAEAERRAAHFARAREIG